MGLGGGASFPLQQPACREDVILQTLGQGQPPGSVPKALPGWLCCPTGVPCFSSAPQIHCAEGQTALCCAMPLPLLSSRSARAGTVQAVRNTVW